MLELPGNLDKHFENATNRTMHSAVVKSVVPNKIYIKYNIKLHNFNDFVRNKKQ